MCFKCYTKRLTEREREMEIKSGRQKESERKISSVAFIRQISSASSSTTSGDSNKDEAKLH